MTSWESPLRKTSLKLRPCEPTHSAQCLSFQQMVGPRLRNNLTKTKGSLFKGRLGIWTKAPCSAACAALKREHAVCARHARRGSLVDLYGYANLRMIRRKDAHASFLREGESRWHGSREFTRQSFSGRPLSLAARLVISAKSMKRTVLPRRSNQQPVSS